MPNSYDIIDHSFDVIVLGAGSARLTDACFIAAAEASADQVGPSLRARGMLFPSQSDILETEVTTATRVAEFMIDQGLAQVERPRDIRAWIEGQLYKPQY
jgi:malate dehydrogenase (oxaloacetate-decarboxylating)(NADP+)